MPAFATPVAAYQWPDSEAPNRELAALVLALEREGGGITRSNIGGWHSPTDFLRLANPAIKQLRERIQQMTAAITRATAIVSETPRNVSYRMEGWANVSRHGHYNMVHNHPGCLWSGTYYVSTGVPDPDTTSNGRLELVDPRAGANMVTAGEALMPNRYLITPLPGLMVMFPSWLQHLVHPFFGRGERISIAFNLLKG